MTRSDHPLDQTELRCPMCGSVVEDPYAEGVNAKICIPCGHNLHIHNPDVLHVIGPKNTFQIWVYYLPVNTWDHDFYGFIESSEGVGLRVSSIGRDC